MRGDLLSCRLAVELASADAAARAASGQTYRISACGWRCRYGPSFCCWPSSWKQPACGHLLLRFTCAAKPAARCAGSCGARPCVLRTFHASCVSTADRRHWPRLTSPSREVPWPPGRQHPDRDQVKRADQPVADAEAARPGDRVPQPHRPVMLEQDQRGRGIVQDIGQHIPLLRASKGWMLSASACSVPSSAPASARPRPRCRAR